MGILKKAAIIVLILPVLTFGQTVKAVRIIGNNALSLFTVRSVMETKPAPIPFITGENKFSQSTLKKDLKNIRSLYRRRGYLFAEATAEVSVDSLGRAYIIVKITEGNQYFFDSYTTEGCSYIPYGKLHSIVGFKRGEVFNAERLSEIEQGIWDFSADIGYPYTRTTITVDTLPEQRVRINISVDKGKLVHFGETRISGLRFSSSLIVKRELTFHTGDVFSQKKIKKSRQNLYELGIFNSVRITAVDIEDEPDTVDILITLFERKPNWFGLRLGAIADTSYSLSLDASVEWGNRNLFKMARSIKFSAANEFLLFTSWENLRNRFTISYREPWVMETRTPGELTFYFEPGNYRETRQYRIQRLGGEISISHRFTQYTRLGFGFGYERADIFGVKSPELAERIRQEEGIVIQRRVTFLVERDSRNSPIYPTEGSVGRAKIEYAGGILGGDDNFAKLDLLWTRYQEIESGFVLASRLRLADAGNLAPGEDILPHNRFRLGGGSSVRGFEEFSMGPRDKTGLPTGGKVLFLANYELRFPIYWKLGGTIFADAGNLWDNYRSVKPENIRFSSGMGIQFLSPVGPVRLDYAERLTRLDAGTNGMWHFGLLYAF